MDAQNDLMNASALLKQVSLGRTTFYKWVKEGKIKPKVFGTTKVYSLKEIKQHLKSLNSRRSEKPD